MKLNTEEHHQLERFITDACAQQPLRAAPAGLQQRVLRKLAQRQALPWWRQSFMHWPWAMRLVFMVAAAGAAQSMLLLAAWLNPRVNSVATTVLVQPASWLQGATRVWLVGHDLLMQLFNHIPLLWLYAASLWVVTLYAALICLSAAAYGSLYRAR